MSTPCGTTSYKVYCHMTNIPGCGGGGWTLVMKLNENKVGLLSWKVTFNQLVCSENILHVVTEQNTTNIVTHNISYDTFTYSSSLWTSNETLAVEDTWRVMSSKQSYIIYYNGYTIRSQWEPRFSVLVHYAMFLWILYLNRKLFERKT